MDGIDNIIVYIDDLLIHSKSHEHHLQILDVVMACLLENNMKINVAKCFFGNTEVNYLGFRLTPEGIKPGKDKLKAVAKAKIPETKEEIKSFVGLCNFFRTHIKDFARICEPLNKDHLWAKLWTHLNTCKQCCAQNQSWPTPDLIKHTPS